MSVRSHGKLLWLSLLLLGNISDVAAEDRGSQPGAIALQQNGTQLSRRLFLGLPDLGKVASMASKASQWIVDETKKVGTGIGNALGINQVLDVLKQGKKFVSDGLAVAQACWVSIRQLITQLGQVYTQFKPLVPVFADGKTGLVSLLSNRQSLQTLVHTVQGLLNTSSSLQHLSDALHTSSAMFGNISTFFARILTGVTGRRLQLEAAGHHDSESAADWAATERRLLDFTSLLSGLNFTALQHTFQGFVSSVIGYSTTLTRLDSTLGGILSNFDALLSRGGRRLGIAADQQRYAADIKEVIPVWQGLEQLNIGMCPIVLGAQEGAASLVCRVQGFIDKLGVFSSISGLVSNCGADPMASASTNVVGTGCPSTSMSAGIQNLIGENAGMIGWLLAIGGAAAACCAAGGGGAAMLLKGGGDEEDDDEDVEEGEEDELNPAEDGALYPADASARAMSRG